MAVDQAPDEELGLGSCQLVELSLETHWPTRMRAIDHRTGPLHSSNMWIMLREASASWSSAKSGRRRRFHGGIIAGYYGARHPDAAVVSIDGFAAGTLPHHSPEEAEEFAAWAAATRMGLELMTAPPETGDAAWMEEQVTGSLAFFDQLQYGSAHPETEARREFVALGDGRFRRHPARRVLAETGRWAASVSSAKAPSRIHFEGRDYGKGDRVKVPGDAVRRGRTAGGGAIFKPADDADALSVGVYVSDGRRAWVCGLVGGT